MAASRGSSWLKWVGPSMGPAVSPRDAAVASSWTLECPPYDWSASIWTGDLSGPVRLKGVSEVGLSIAATVSVCGQGREDSKNGRRSSELWSAR